MPHFIVDCAVEILESNAEEYIAEQIYLVAVASDLFDSPDIKVRVNPYSKYMWEGNVSFSFTFFRALCKVAQLSSEHSYHIRLLRN